MSAPRNIIAELHCHTQFSMDGLITYDGLRKTAAQRGINVVCITDHDTIEGAKEFQARARGSGDPLQIVVGEERTLADKSHLIGLFIQEHITSNTLAGAIEEIHSQGGFVLMPHPFRKKDGLLRDIEQPNAEAVRGIDAFELFSAKGSFADNERARSLLSLPLGVFGGSDAHYESDIGQCVCELPLRGSTEESLRAMLKKQSPFTIRGIHKDAGSDERRYAPMYYRVKRFIRVPRPLLPAAKQIYRFYRNRLLEPSAPVLEQIYAHE
jgi:predicted metal-dependent phosphoesterase TrpH